MTSPPPHPDPRASTTLYKLLTPSEFTSLPLPPTLWYGTPFDISTTPSSIHLATSHQLPNTLSIIFPDAHELWILAIPRTEKLEGRLRWVGEEGCVELEGPIDVWSEVAVRRPIGKVGGEWDVGELQY